MAVRAREHGTAGAGGTLSDRLADLAARVPCEVRADDATRALFATDAGNYRHAPLAVATPRHAEDVLAILEACRDLELPVLPRGAGTSLAGQACNEAVVVDMTRHVNRVVSVDAESRTARVQPGCVLDVLQLAARPHGLRFGPDPSSHDRCTLGGMIANDACGARSLVHGRTSANVVALDVALQDGTRLVAGALGDSGLAAWCSEDSRRGTLARALRALRDRSADLVRARFPKLRRRVSGYALDALLPESGVDLARALCATEGTCAVTLEATVKLVALPGDTALVVLGCDDVVAAAEAVPLVLEHAPSALEAVEASLLPSRHRGLLPEGGAWLYAEVEPARAGALVAAARRPARVVVDKSHVRLLWAVREAGVGATARLGSGRRTHPGWEDAAVPPERLPSYLRAFRALLARFGYEAAIYGHFGEGCVHARITFDLASAGGVARFRAFLDEAADLVVAHEGSLSGEHGDGQARGALLERMYGPGIVGAFREFKRAWDPAGLLNPGRLVDARAPDADLRVAQLAPRADAAPTLSFAQDGGTLSSAALGCVGVGSCRRDAPGGMCPSFRATRDERHSPRGRAHLVAEWRAGHVPEEDVAEALGLCLSCKACRTECPAGVDVAAMKAEFLAIRHASTPRPRIHRLARMDRGFALAARAPRLVNAVMRLPFARRVMERVAGVAREVTLPPFASRTFHAAWRDGAGPRDVTLFVDCATDALAPDVAHAAARVLARAGASVSAPRLSCCARPLYEVGRLGEARERVRRLVHALPAQGDIVAVEPACASMLRDDALRLLPDDERAASVASRVRFFAEWAAAHAAALPSLRGVLAQPHCHERALGDPDASLHALGGEALDLGCCGLAGPFGLDARHRELSLRIGELGVLPALRDAGATTTIVADGASCRLQARDATGREPLHLAQAIEAAWRGAPRDATSHRDS